MKNNVLLNSSALTMDNGFTVSIQEQIKFRKCDSGRKDARSTIYFKIINNSFSVQENV